MALGGTQGQQSTGRPCLGAELWGLGVSADVHTCADVHPCADLLVSHRPGLPPVTGFRLKTPMCASFTSSFVPTPGLMSQLVPASPSPHQHLP